MRIAVIGSGIAGIGASWALSQHHETTLFEASDRLGGHSRTLEVPVDGQTTPVDTGFIVYNERNYPNLVRLFDTLGVETQESDMSFAVSLDDADLEYGGRIGAMFSSLRALGDRRVWDIVRGLRRFRSERDELRSGSVDSDASIHDYLEARGYPDGFIRYYLMPLASAVWSGTRNNAHEMPAGTFLSFLDNHGLVKLTDRPQWRTVTGGAQSYVRRASKEITRVHTGRPIRSLNRVASGVEVVDRDGCVDVYDHVVVATHADVALRLLGDPASDRERDILSAFRYDTNEVVLHTDPGLMPRRRSVWSAWNAMERSEDDGSRPVSVSYWMNRLQSIETNLPLIVTLNPGRSVDPSHVIDRWTTMHPQFDTSTDRAQAAMPSIQGRDRIWFAGAHLGYGFHEDGLQSGLTVAAALGSPAPWHDSIVAASTAARHAAPDRRVLVP